jgi:hypothetical protein
VNAGKDVSDKPGASVTLKAVIDAADGSTVSAIKWTQTAGVPATLSGADSDTLQVALGSDGAYRDALLAGVTDDDRFGVQPVNPHALSAAEVATFKVSVTTTSGTYSDSVNVNAELPYVTSTGVENVPINVPVLLRAKTRTPQRAIPPLRLM